jgi:hypothetical protein
MSKTQKCGSEDPFTYRGVGCGTRSGYGGVQVWLPIKALRGPYRFVVGAAFLGPISSRGGGKLDPYPDCVVYPSHRYPDEAALQCLNSSLNRQEGRLVGTPQYDWFDPNELLMVYDTRPYKQTCLTGASPMFDGRALQDCSKKTITVKKPEDDYAFNDTRPDDPNRADDGWTSTTKIAWEFTLKRVGCGKA